MRRVIIFLISMIFWILGFHLIDDVKLGYGIMFAILASVISREK